MKPFFLTLLFFSSLALSAEPKVLLSCNILSGPVAEVDVYQEDGALTLRVLKTSGAFADKPLSLAAWKNKKINFIEKSGAGKWRQFGELAWVDGSWSYRYKTSFAAGSGFADCQE